MLKIIRDLLLEKVYDIDTGNSNISEEEEEKLIKIFRLINDKELSKIESANYVGVCRATFDNYIKKGLIPKGHKRLGFNALGWNKSDLDEFNKMKKKKKK